jgi:hypothetical protein
MVKIFFVDVIKGEILTSKIIIVDYKLMITPNTEQN